MAKTFLTADTHFGHKGICRFLRGDGSKDRPWDDEVEMTRDMVELWNSTVGKDDLVYCLGDFCINRRYLHVAGDLNGRKKLVMGNHDVFRSEEYLAYFQEIMAYKSLGGFMCSHIPLHPSNLGRWEGNFHGHTHTHRVMLNDTEIDKRYLCLSVEHTNYAPITLEQAIKRWEEQQ